MPDPPIRIPSVLRDPLFVAGIVGATLLVVLFYRLVAVATARKWMQGYIDEKGLDAEIVRFGWPPARYWFVPWPWRGDFWAKVRFSDGTERWARLRGSLIEKRGYSVKFFS